MVVLTEAFWFYIDSFSLLLNLVKALEGWRDE